MMRKLPTLHIKGIQSLEGRELPNGWFVDSVWNDLGGKHPKKMYKIGLISTTGETKTVTLYRHPEIVPHNGWSDGKRWRVEYINTYGKESTEWVGMETLGSSERFMGLLTFICGVIPIKWVPPKSGSI